MDENGKQVILTPAIINKIGNNAIE